MASHFHRAEKSVDSRGRPKEHQAYDPYPSHPASSSGAANEDDSVRNGGRPIRILDAFRGCGVIGAVAMSRSLPAAADLTSGCRNRDDDGCHVTPKPRILADVAWIGLQPVALR